MISKAWWAGCFFLCSMVALILLHMYMYGANLFYWRRMRINYPFIFEFQPGTELRHREVLMVTSILTTLLIGAMVGQLTLHTATLSAFVDLIPFCLVLVSSPSLWPTFHVLFEIWLLQTSGNMICQSVFPFPLSVLMARCVSA